MVICSCEEKALRSPTFLLKPVCFTYVIIILEDELELIKLDGTGKSFQDSGFSLIELQSVLEHYTVGH